MIYDAIIIGAGACGLMCAVQAGYLGKKVLLLEKNDKPGAKILISGGGRCNYTNIITTEEQFITENNNFLKSAFSQWSVDDTISFFESNGIYGAEKTLGQIFPINHNAKDIVKIFTSLCNDFGQQILCNIDVENIEKVKDIYSISTNKHSKYQMFKSKSLVVCTGGLPIAKMGATDFALRFAKKHQLNIIPTAPALVPLTITGKDLEWFSKLSGNSIFCKVSNQRISFEENILFTHWGLSGPAILQISSYWRKGEELEIDMLPNHNIVELLTNKRKENGTQHLSTFLNQFFTKNVVNAFAKYISLEQQIANLSKSDFTQLDKIIHHFTVKPAGDKGYDKAEVMRGGIDTNELSSKTLESKKIKSCFFGGECVDITGWLGGYNFQWAWSSAYVIAQNI